MNDPTLHHARRVLQALELEDRIAHTVTSSNLVTLARQLVSAIEVARQKEQGAKHAD